MKLIIDIDDSDYKRIKDLVATDTRYTMATTVGTAYQVIANGTVLPEGHGRLVDENHIIAELVYRKNLLADNVKCGQITEIFNSAVVIDADKGSNNETYN